jgi:hypothetical protein
MDTTVSDSTSLAVFAYGLTIVVAVLTAGMIWLVVRVLDHLHHRREAAAKAVAAPVAISVAPAVDETAHHVAVVAAAVYAILGAHRLVYIGDAARAHTWSATGRTIHHFSHSPKRSSEK